MTRPQEYETCAFDVKTWFICSKYEINFKVQHANVQWIVRNWMFKLEKKE